MRTWVAVWLVVIGLTAGVAGCQSPAGRATVTHGSVPTPDPAAARAAGLSPSEVDSGRRLYVAKCARCHKFYDPAGYNAGQWDVWMRKMSRRAKLQPAEEELIRRYLGAFRPRGWETAPKKDARDEGPGAAASAAHSQ